MKNPIPIRQFTANNKRWHIARYDNVLHCTEHESGARKEIPYANNAAAKAAMNQPGSLGL